MAVPSDETNQISKEKKDPLSLLALRMKGLNKAMMYPEKAPQKRRLDYQRKYDVVW